MITQWSAWFIAQTGIAMFFIGVLLIVFSARERR